MPPRRNPTLAGDSSLMSPSGFAGNRISYADTLRLVMASPDSSIATQEECQMMGMPSMHNGPPPYSPQANNLNLYHQDANGLSPYNKQRKRQSHMDGRNENRYNYYGDDGANIYSRGENHNQNSAMNRSSVDTKSRMAGEPEPPPKVDRGENRRICGRPKID